MMVDESERRKVCQEIWGFHPLKPLTHYLPSLVKHVDIVVKHQLLIVTQLYVTQPLAVLRVIGCIQTASQIQIISKNVNLDGFFVVQTLTNHMKSDFISQ